MQTVQQVAHHDDAADGEKDTFILICVCTLFLFSNDFLKNSPDSWLFLVEKITLKLIEFCYFFWPKHNQNWASFISTPKTFKKLLSFLTIRLDSKKLELLIKKQDVFSYICGIMIKNIQIRRRFGSNELKAVLTGPCLSNIKVPRNQPFSTNSSVFGRSGKF